MIDLRRIACAQIPSTCCHDRRICLTSTTSCRHHRQVPLSLCKGLLWESLHNHKALDNILKCLVLVSAVVPLDPHVDWTCCYFESSSPSHMNKWIAVAFIAVIILESSDDAVRWNVTSAISTITSHINTIVLEAGSHYCSGIC